MTHHYHPKSIVYIKIYSWCWGCTILLFLFVLILGGLPMLILLCSCVCLYTHTHIYHSYMSSSELGTGPLLCSSHWSLFTSHEHMGQKAPQSLILLVLVYLLKRHPTVGYVTVWSLSCMPERGCTILVLSPTVKEHTHFPTLTDYTILHIFYFSQFYDTLFKNLHFFDN